MPVASVIIPAHNEENVIGRCLAMAFRDAAPGEFEIVVVANACTDRTVDVVRAHDPAITILESPIGSKPVALNLGDQAAETFPRIYLDADVEVTTDTLRATAGVLAAGAPAAAPRMRLDLSGVSRAVRAYYSVWTKLPWWRQGFVGSGFYGMSREGRGRFDHFPETLAEDLFVRETFDVAERATVDAEFVMHPPRSLPALVRIRARRMTGNLDYARAHGGPGVHREPAGYGKIVRSEPRLAPALVLYAVVTLVAQVWARVRLRRGDLAWSRDLSSRDHA